MEILNQQFALNTQTMQAQRNLAAALLAATTKKRVPNSSAIRGGLNWVEARKKFVHFENLLFQRKHAHDPDLSDWIGEDSEGAPVLGEIADLDSHLMSWADSPLLETVLSKEFPEVSARFLEIAVQQLKV